MARRAAVPSPEASRASARGPEGPDAGQHHAGGAVDRGGVVHQTGRRPEVRSAFSAERRLPMP